jgi:hypothetical protein|tara:strand:+ start:663 stop:1751 length:1089 start_codon:yes stop_codon:yes gene_type:complete
MASTYSDRLKLEIMATGANANTWGTNTNNNLEVIDAFAAGFLSKSVAGSANITLSTANASDTAESSNKTIDLNGALTGDIVVFIPAVESEYNFFNNTSGSQTLTIAATGHTANGVVITQGAKTTVFCDGASNYNVEIISSTDAGALGAGTLPDARFPATLPAASGVNLTALNASNLGSGTVPNARLDAQLQDVAGLAVTDSGIIVGDGSNFVLETGATMRTSLGLGTGSDVQFDSFGVATAASGTSGEIRATNDITAFYSSDVSLKENIHNISSPMDKVQNLNGVLFDWKQSFIDSKGGEDGYFVRRTDVGVIAQDVEKVLPEVVGTRPDGVKAVKYDRLCALLIECVKDLQTQVNDLKKGN